MPAHAVTPILRALGRVPLVPEYLIDRAHKPVTVTKLSEREAYVILLLSHGCSLQQSADAIGIRYETARAHLSNARFKLRAKNRTHAVALAIRHGVIQ